MEGRRSSRFNLQMGFAQEDDCNEMKGVNTGALVGGRKFCRSLAEGRSMIFFSYE